MKFSTVYQEFYKESLRNNEGSEALKMDIAQKTFHKKENTTFQAFAKMALAATVFTMAGSVFAPRAFAETIKFTRERIDIATDAFTVVVTRVFDGTRDMFSDEAVTSLTEDPSVSSLQYVRDENGEFVEWTENCEVGGGCAASLPDLEFQDGEWTERVHIETSSNDEGGSVTFTAEGE